MSARVLGLRGSCRASSPLASTESVFASRKASRRCVTGAAGVVGMRCAGSMSVSLYWLIGARSSSGSVGSSGGIPGSILGLPPAAVALPPIRLCTAVSTFQSCASRNEMANPSSSVPETALNTANFSASSAIPKRPGLRHQAKLHASGGCIPPHGRRPIHDRQIRPYARACSAPGRRGDELKLTTHNYPFRTYRPTYSRRRPPRARLARLVAAWPPPASSRGRGWRSTRGPVWVGDTEVGSAGSQVRRGGRCAPRDQVGDDC